MTVTLYGISNCDTVRKARAWLNDQGVAYRFHDFRSDGVDAKELERWLHSAGWETVLNRRSTSWKALAPEAREAMDVQHALSAAIVAPTLVKRPVLVSDNVLEFGFSPSRYTTLLKLQA